MNFENFIPSVEFETSSLIFNINQLFCTERSTSSNLQIVSFIFYQLIKIFLFNR